MIRGDFNARHLLGVMRAQSGRMDEGLADIALALQIKPDDPEALLNHANVLKASGPPGRSPRRI